MKVAGGPMYYILNGLGKKFKPLAYFFSVACVLVAFLGIGTFPQVNAIVDSFETTFGVSRIMTDAVLTLLVAAVTLGGLQSIAKVTEMIVPFMAAFYIIISIGLILLNITNVPAA